MRFSGLVRIYHYKGKKQGKVYRWEQVKILVKKPFANLLKPYNGREVSFSIIENEASIIEKNDSIIEKYSQALRLLLEKFLSLPSGCQEKIQLSEEEAILLKEIMQEFGFV